MLPDKHLPCMSDVHVQASTSRLLSKRNGISTVDYCAGMYGAVGNMFRIGMSIVHFLPACRQEETSSVLRTGVSIVKFC